MPALHRKWGRIARPQVPSRSCDRAIVEEVTALAIRHVRAARAISACWTPSAIEQHLKSRRSNTTEPGPKNRTARSSRWSEGGTDPLKNQIAQIRLQRVTRRRETRARVAEPSRGL